MRGRPGRRALASLVLVSLVGAGPAAAQPATAQPATAQPATALPPVVDVADLPPLPESEDAPTTAATVLAASAAEEDVVVGAAKREQSLGNVASAVTVVTADRIRRFGYRNISEAIAGVAGIYIQDTRLTHQVGVRGLQIPGGFNSRILVLIDGATVNEFWGAFAGVTYDALVSIDDIQRIEVIRGPVGAVYGSNAFLAILNIVTKNAAEQSRAWGRVTVGSINGAVANAGFAAGDVNKQIRGSIYALTRFGESYYVPEIGSSLDGDGGASLIGSLVASYNGSFLQVRAMRASRDSAFAPYDSDPALDPPFKLFNNQLLVEGGHTRELSKKLTLAVRGYGTMYRYRDEINYAADDRFNDIGDVATVGAEVRARYELVDEGKLGITAGTEANYNQTESRAFSTGDEANAVQAPLDFSILGIYSELDGQPLPWLGFTAGLRFDNNSAFSSRLSPRAALFLSDGSKAPRYGLKLLYAEGFRNASAFESYFADGVDFAANEDINPETIRSYEAVAWAKPVAGLSTRLSGWYWDARDVIEQVPISVGEQTLLQFQNIGRYVTTGVEVEASYRNSEGWYGFAGATFARVGRSTADSGLEYGEVVNAPAITANAGISTPRLWDRMHVSADLVMLGERATRDPTIDSPAWFGLGGALFVPNLKKFDLTLGVRNLIGRKDRIPAPDDYDRFPTPDTTVLVSRIPGEGRELYVKLGYSY